MADEDLQIVLDEAKEAMDKALRSLKAEYQKVRTGRANPQLLDGLQVDYYGAPTPINQLANLTAPDARLIVVSPFDQTAIGDIEKAILAADLGLTPSNDGKVVRIPVPPLTEERRKDLVKQLKKTAEEHKIGVREARRDALAMLKELENDGALGADDRRRAEKSVQDLTDAHTKTIDEMTSTKEEEILQV
ncbi:MAG: ribosome recycling factor [Myxococcota bacterium]|nr:ribosome recycling factor [Myxococcota bacterium]